MTSCYKLPTLSLLVWSTLCEQDRLRHFVNEIKYCTGKRTVLPCGIYRLAHIGKVAPLRRANRRVSTPVWRQHTGGCLYQQWHASNMVKRVVPQPNKPCKLKKWYEKWRCLFLKPKDSLFAQNVHSIFFLHSKLKLLWQMFDIGFAVFFLSGFSYTGFIIMCSLIITV